MIHWRYSSNMIVLTQFVKKGHCGILKSFDSGAASFGSEAGSFGSEAESLGSEAGSLAAKPGSAPGCRISPKQSETSARWEPFQCRGYCRVWLPKQTTNMPSVATTGRSSGVKMCSASELLTFQSGPKPSHTVAISCIWATW